MEAKKKPVHWFRISRQFVPHTITVAKHINVNAIGIRSAFERSAAQTGSPGLRCFSRRARGYTRRRRFVPYSRLIILKRRCIIPHAVLRDLPTLPSQLDPNLLCSLMPLSTPVTSRYVPVVYSLVGVKNQSENITFNNYYNYHNTCTILQRCYVFRYLYEPTSTSL
jgi:hypothetical protein